MRMVCLIAFAVMALSASALEVDGIAAKIDDQTILKSEVVNEMRRMGLQDASRYNEVRNEMIDRMLILRAAKAAKMTMQEWVVENRVREIINKGFGGDRNKLLEALSKQRISYPEWYAKTKDELVVSAMRWNVVDKNVSASPAAMKAEYEQHKDRYVKDHKVSLSVIMLKPDEVSKRDEISEALKSKDFDELGGRKYTDVKPDEMFKPEIAEEIAKMPKGTISHWIELDGWSFLIRKDGESVGKALSFDEAYDEVEAAVKESEAKRLYRAWIERLKAETYIKVF